MKRSKKILPSVSSLFGKTNLFPLLSPPFGEACRKVTQFGLSRKLQLGLREVWQADELMSNRRHTSFSYSHDRGKYR
jgi:hypothetical protein